MISLHQQEHIKRMYAAQDDFRVLEIFWQDHFYATEGRFGYPVCVHLDNYATQQTEDSLVLGYHVSREGCQAQIDDIEAYIATLKAEGAKA